MPADGISWTAHARVERFSPAQTAAASALAGGAEPSAEHLRATGAPEHGIADEHGNILVTAGLALITNLIEGGGGTPFAHADAILAVGSTATAATIADTALGADNTAGAWYQQADVGFPTASGGLITCQSTFGTTSANFTWAEWCLATGSGGITPGIRLSLVATSPTMLNHKIAALGTKASGAAWVLTATVTLA